MKQTLFSLPTQVDIDMRLSRPLAKAGISHLQWSTAREPDDTESYLTELSVEDADGRPLPPWLVRSGFLTLYAISDSLARDGGSFDLDVASGRYKRIDSIRGPRYLRGTALPGGSELDGDLGEIAG